MKIIKEDAVWALKSAMADIVMESNEYEVPGEKVDTLNTLNEDISYDHFKKVMLSEGILDTAKKKISKFGNSIGSKAFDMTQKGKKIVSNYGDDSGKAAFKVSDKINKSTKQVKYALSGDNVKVAEAKAKRARKILAKDIKKASDARSALSKKMSTATGQRKQEMIKLDKKLATQIANNKKKFQAINSSIQTNKKQADYDMTTQKRINKNQDLLRQDDKNNSWEGKIKAGGKLVKSGLGYTAQQLKSLTGKVGSKINSGLNGNNIAMGVSIAAALTGAYYIYKRFLSQAAKQCSKLSGEKKTLCMKKFKVKAGQAAIKKLQGTKRQFKNNPKKLASINKHIASWKAKITNY